MGALPGQLGEIWSQRLRIVLLYDENLTHWQIDNALLLVLKAMAISEKQSRKQDIRKEQKSKGNH